MARSVGITVALLCGLGKAWAVPPKPAPPAPQTPALPQVRPAGPASSRSSPSAPPQAAPRTSAPPQVRPASPAPSRPPPSQLGSHYLVTPTDVTLTAAYRYAQLTRAECEAELTRRHIEFKRQSASGVLVPVRLVGRLNGVLFRTDLSEKERVTTPHEIADCRLILALDDFAAILRAHDVVEVRHYSMYRLPPDSWPKGQPARAHLGAMALDAGRFVTKSGSELDVDRDFHGAIGAKTCGPGAAPRPATAAATKLRSILCQAVDQRLFNVVLTPNYNAPHKNHFHLEVTAGVKWFLVN